MARFIKTVSSTGGSTGGGAAGVSLADVCKAVCCVVYANATCTTGTIEAKQDFAEDGSYANRTSQIIPGYGCWEMICNCPYWSDSYGCCIIWCIDTMKYRAFNIVYSGIRNCKCCHYYPCLGFGTETCFCQCSQAYRGRSVLCGWPTWPGCCCGSWQDYNCEQILNNYCIQCMNAEAKDTQWGFQFMICAPQWKRTVSQNTGGGVFYDVRMASKYMCNCTAYCYSDYSRFKGQNFCSCLMWNCNQNSNYYVSRMCMKVSNQQFMSALCSSSTTPCEGGSCSAGVPCWTIWGQPCIRPMFGTCSMSTAG